MSNFWKPEYDNLEFKQVMKDVFQRIEIARNYILKSQYKANLYKELLGSKYTIENLKLSIDWLLAGKFFPSNREIILEDFYNFKESSFKNSRDYIHIEEVKNMINLNTQNIKNDLNKTLRLTIENEFISKYSENQLVIDNQNLTFDNLNLIKCKFSLMEKVTKLEKFVANLRYKLNCNYDDHTARDISNIIGLDRIINLLKINEL